MFAGATLLVLAALFAVFPRALVYPLLFFFVWFGVALLVRSARLHRQHRLERRARALEDKHDPGPS
jgi:hypothetical protein